jgi:hypothetical protein
MDDLQNFSKQEILALIIDMAIEADLQVCVPMSDNTNIEGIIIGSDELMNQVKALFEIDKYQPNFENKKVH